MRDRSQGVYSEDILVDLLALLQTGLAGFTGRTDLIVQSTESGLQKQR